MRISIYTPRTVLVTMLSFRLAATALPASALGLFGSHGNGLFFEGPVRVGSGHHGRGHHRHGWPGHRHRGWHRPGHGHGRGHWPHHTMEHRHGGLGWHVHRGWRHHGHPAPRRHGRHRNDDWEEGGGIALGVLAGLLLLNELSDGGGGAAASGAGHTGIHSPFLDAYSRQRQGEAIRRVLDAGGNSVAAWDNPANRGGRAGGEVRITRNGRDDYGNPCREYHQTVRIGGRLTQGHRVACRDRNGNWHLQ